MTHQDSILKTDRKQQAESFARGGIKAMGVCMALTPNELLLFVLVVLHYLYFLKVQKH